MWGRHLVYAWSHSTFHHPFVHTLFPQKLVRRARIIITTLERRKQKHKELCLEGMAHPTHIMCPWVWPEAVIGTG